MPQDVRDSVPRMYKHPIDVPSKSKPACRTRIKINTFLGHDKRQANAARIWAVNQLVSSMVLKNNVPWAELCDPKQAKHKILQDILAECHAQFPVTRGLVRGGNSVDCRNCYIMSAIKNKIHNVTASAAGEWYLSLDFHICTDLIFYCSTVLQVKTKKL